MTIIFLNPSYNGLFSCNLRLSFLNGHYREVKLYTYFTRFSSESGYICPKKTVLSVDGLFYFHKLSVCQTTYIVNRKWVPIREFKIYLPFGLVVIVLCPLRNVSQESFLTCHQFLRAVSGLELVFIDEHHRVPLLLDPRVHNGLYVKIFAHLDKKMVNMMIKHLFC